MGLRPGRTFQLQAWHDNNRITAAHLGPSAALLVDLERKILIARSAQRVAELLGGLRGTRRSTLSTQRSTRSTQGSTQIRASCSSARGVPAQYGGARVAQGQYARCVRLVSDEPTKRGSCCGWAVHGSCRPPGATPVCGCSWDSVAASPGQSSPALSRLTSSLPSFHQLVSRSFLFWLSTSLRHAPRAHVSTSHART